MYSRMFGSSQMVCKEYMFARRRKRETEAAGILRFLYTIPNTGQSSENREYFLDDNGVVCSWLLNGPQPTDDNTVESVKTYLAGVL